MQDFLVNVSNDYGRIIVFLHIVGASFLLGSMFMIRFIIKPMLMNFEDETVRFGMYIKILDRYFYFLIVIMVLIISASLTMVSANGFEYATPTLYSLVHVKEAIWVFIVFNFVFMYVRFINTKRLYKTREFFEVNENLSLIVSILMPLNIILTLIAVYIGVIIRGI